MRTIAQSKTEELFHVELNRLKQMDEYKTVIKFKNWIDRQWVPECRVCGNQIHSNENIELTKETTVHYLSV